MLFRSTVAGGTLSGFSGSGTSYTASFVPTTNSTANGTVDVAAGAFTDSAGNPSTAATQLVLTVDTKVPAVSSVQGTSGTYRSGNAVTVTVTFDDTVYVTTGGGTPSIGLDLGTTRQASYVSGSGTSTLTFRYTAVDGDLSGDLQYAST